MSARNEATATPTPERIRIALALHRVSATELAHEVGTHPTVLSRILNEHEAAPAETLARIHRGLLEIVLKRAGGSERGQVERRADYEEGWEDERSSGTASRRPQE